MGLLVEGRWQDVWYPTKSTGGRFVRKDAAFRNWITVDGSAGPTGIGGFKSEAGRYHLYVSLACPWAHRTLIMRMLKGLEAKISVSVAHWLMLEHGWTFADGPGVVPDKSTMPNSCMRSTPLRIRTTPAGPQFRCCGTSTGAPSSITNPPRSSGC